MTRDQVQCLTDLRDHYKALAKVRREAGVEYELEEREANALKAALDCIRNRGHVVA